ncbi:MAG: hypothetical protein C0507_12580 [Cyanobacteria bacterium PR.3.49]|nr:hypothetical protein [Cyanobacteria bacterium PR.3.49]
MTGCTFKQALDDLRSTNIKPVPITRLRESNQSSGTNLSRFMTSVWNQGHEISAGDPVNDYLRSRGLELDAVPGVLRFHEALKYKHEDIDYGFFPAMLASVQSVSGEMVCVHRTYLSGSGCGKAEVPKPKKLMPCAISGATKGAAIRLFPAGRKLALAEGIETALAFTQIFGTPSWATVSAVGMENIQLPDEVEEVYLCVDVDRKGRGEQAVDVAAHRLLTDGRKVFKATPPGELLAGQKSKDWLDFLVERQASQINVDEVENDPTIR